MNSVKLYALGGGCTQPGSGQISALTDAGRAPSNTSHLVDGPWFSHGLKAYNCPPGLQMLMALNPSMRGRMTQWGTCASFQQVHTDHW